MKKTTTLIKTSLASLFLLFLTSTVFGQGTIPPAPTGTISTPANLNLGTANDGVAPITTVADAIMFYNPATDGPDVTLTASETDALTGLNYTEYIWHNINHDGSIESTFSTVTRTLNLTDLGPGYHRIRVYGIIDADGIECQSDEFQDMIIFVLRPLSITSDTPTGAITEFCLGEAPANNLEFTSATLFDATHPYANTDFPNPAVDSFDLTYRWYAINSENPTTQIDLGTTKDLSLDLETLTDYGNYTFHVEVQYANTLKDRGTRDFAIWTATVGGAATPYTLTVSRKPGRATITITTVNDN